MAAVAAGHRMGLVSAGWPALLLSCANGCRKQHFHLVGAPFLAVQAAFSLEERSFRKQHFHLVGAPFLVVQAAFSLEERSFDGGPRLLNAQ